MRFSTKVFLVTSTLSSVCVLSASYLVHNTAKRLYIGRYEAEYLERLELLARDFVSIEGAYDRAAMNAALAVREVDSAKRGKLTRVDLERLSKELNVGGISLVDAKGDFIRSSGDAPDSNLFDYCPAYRGLLTGEVTEEQTPLVPDKADPSLVAKYTMISNYEGTRIIDVSVKFGEISKMLQQLVDDESDVVAVTLKSPSGQTLGSLRNRTMPANDRSEHRHISTTIAADEADCCECQVRKLVSGSQPYHYVFEAELSTRALNKAVASLQRSVLLVFVALLLLSLLASYWISRTLVKKIQLMRKGVDEVAAAGDFSKTLPVENEGPRGDELDALAMHFNKMFDSMRQAQGELIEAKKAEARAAVASQVAHDIRSPLTSMALALNQLQDVLRRQGVGADSAPLISVLSNGISRVSGIVKRLSKAHGQKTSDATAVEAPRLTLVDKLFFDVAQEHALKLPATLSFDIRGFTPVPQAWAVVQATEIQAALSNVLNNAVEATGPQGAVRLDVKIEERSFTAKVIDNGKGIAPENLVRVFEREFTSGKDGGSGLGLYQAKKAIEWSGGKIKLESILGKGTIVTITLPLEKAPAWLAAEISVPAGRTLVVADDDPTILSAWREKASRAGAKLLEFGTIRELDAALATLGPLDSLVFVLDQYAGDGREGLTGTAFIEKHKLGPAATLSTSEFDDPAIQDRVKLLRARLLPKACLAAAEIKT